MEGDSAIRWQAMGDFGIAPATIIERERNLVSKRGWGSKILSLQNKNGIWGRGLYTPKWISTTYTLLLLRDFGLPQDDEQARRGCKLLIGAGPRPDGGINFVPSPRSEMCITGMVLSICSYFKLRDKRFERVVDFVLDEQMPDGGWNCRKPYGATHSSNNTSISVLEGLHDFTELESYHKKDIAAAIRRGLEFFLNHRMFRSHRTGHVSKPDFLRLAFPPRWHYTILRGLDFFRRVNFRDKRLADAAEVLERKRLPDGTWKLEYEFSGKTFFRMEPVGKPSRWITLQALRVLNWWNR